MPRAATAATVVVALLAVAATGAAALPEVVLATALVVIGSMLSHQRRRADNRLLKAAVAVAAVLVLARFFQQLGSSQTVDDARLPLTSMFLGVQTLHAFDLPRTRDLTFTVSASLALVTLAAASSRSGWFHLATLLWFVLAGFSLWVLRLGAAHRRAGRTLRVDDLLGGAAATPHARGAAGLRVLRGIAGPAFALVAMVAVVFLALPRPEVGSTVALPFQQLRQGIPSPGGVTNPGLPMDGGDGAGSFDPVAYFGLAETVDIRTAGELSDELVLRVRSSRPRLLRGMVFDTYADNRWTRSGVEPTPTRGLPVRLPAEPGQRTPLTQTVEVVTATPNLVFAAGDPLDLYHAGQSASIWSDGTVTVATTQDPGTVYSVISQVPAASEERLRLADGAGPEDATRWLQVPDDVTDRTRALAAELVDPRATNHANAEAVMAWIGEHVAYSLDLEDHDPAADAVDTLLFERRLGWCEPISASMVLLLRLGGVPARWVTGFQPGDFDVLSGMWEVRARHAHAWAEVWVPEHGWISFDPTGAVPSADGPAGPAVRVPLITVLRDVAAWLGRLDGVDWLVLASGALALAVPVVAARRWRRRRQPLSHLPRVRWEPWETPTDLAARLARSHRVPRADLDVLVRAHHDHALRRPPPAGREVHRAHREVRRAIRSRAAR